MITLDVRQAIGEELDEESSVAMVILSVTDDAGKVERLELAFDPRNLDQRVAVLAVAHDLIGLLRDSQPWVKS